MTDSTKTENILLAPLYHLELVRDRDIPYEGSVKTTEQAAQVLHNLLDRSPVEQMVVLYLDSGTKIVGAEKVGMGSVEMVLTHPGEIFRGAIVKGVPEILLSHNHVDGVMEPSNNDLHMTLNMVELGAMLGIRVRDHIIVGPNGKHLSIREHLDRLTRELANELRAGGIDGLKKKLINMIDPTGKAKLDLQIDTSGLPKKVSDPKANVPSDWKESLSYKWLSR